MTVAQRLGRGLGRGLGRTPLAAGWRRVSGRVREAARALDRTLDRTLDDERMPRRGLIKRFLPRTLFGRSLMIIVTPVLLMQAIATFYFYDRHWDTVTERLSRAVVGEIAMIIADLSDMDADGEARAALFRRVSSTMGMLVSFRSQETIETEERRFGFQILERRLDQALHEQIRRPYRFDTRVAEEWAKIEVQLDGGVLEVLVPKSRLFSSTSQVFLLWMVGSGAVLFAVAILFMRNQIRPIRRLANAAERFGKGRDVPAFKPEGALEVRQAARAFLVMRERIQRQITQRTEMLAGVSHDLRTPLTRMKLQLALLGDDPDIAELRADVAEMERMIEGYLAFARGEGSEAPVATDLSALLDEIAIAARREGAELTTAIEPGLVISLRPQAMRRCLGNLISNARRHAPRIWLTAERRGRSVEIAIDDDGPGIPEDRLEEVFRPFFRLDASRNQATGGTGLGLTIARDIARGHGGDIILGPSPEGGLRCLLRLPV
ncbi:MAG: ATP-binding protein [Azospirillaceae bacterium]